ncbi:hypothetical protein D4Q76_01600 [archaeon]|nr:MAG: hypothetical protein D4Q76_01600 [archaeon]
MTWYDVDIAPHDVKALQLVRMGVVKEFETRPKYSSDTYDFSSKVPHIIFNFKLEDTKIIKRPDNLKIKDESFPNIVEGINPPIIDNYDTVGVLSTVPSSELSFNDKIVRKLRFNKTADSSYEVLGTYYIV